MRDILVRLSYTQVPCTCFSNSAKITEHDELCIRRVIREAEVEILRLRAEVEIHQLLGNV